jgi:hypothetical protein
MISAGSACSMLWCTIAADRVSRVRTSIALARSSLAPVNTWSVMVESPSPFAAKNATTSWAKIGLTSSPGLVEVVRVLPG